MPVTVPETALVRELRGLAGNLIQLYGDDLVSLIVYGPAIDRERPPRDGEVQVLIVLREASLETLGKIQDTMAAWWKSHRVAPLFVGHREFQRSLDVFPLEFLNMKTRYICLHGQDVLAEMTIQKEHLRLQMEEDLKTKAFWLRQLFVRDGRRERSLRTLLVESFGSLARSFGGLLLLQGRPVPAQPEALGESVAEAYRLDPSVMKDLQLITAGTRRPGFEELTRLAYAYDRLLDTLVEAVDTMETS